jgi:hypothetical protein
MSRITSLILVSLTLFALAIPQSQAAVRSGFIRTPLGMRHVTVHRGPFGRTVLRSNRLGARRGRTIVRGPLGHIRVR